MAAADNSSVQEIDRILAQADALMDELSGELRSPPGPTAADGNELDGDRDSQITAEAGRREELIDAPAASLSGSTESVDPHAVASALGQSDAGQAASSEQTIDPAVPQPPDGPAESREPPPDEGAQSAPREWLDEADPATEAGKPVLDHLPRISEDATAETRKPATAAARLRAVHLDGLARAGGILLHLPIDLLILLDRPFAHLSARRKACLGYAAIATLVVAIATWLAGEVVATS